MGHYDDQREEYEREPAGYHKRREDNLKIYQERYKTYDSASHIAVPIYLLESLCEDVESAVEARYGEPVHPSQTKRYERDMVDVQEAREILNEMKERQTHDWLLPRRFRS